MSELQVISTGNQESDTHIVLCHGFGATNRDLVDLAAYLDPTNRYGWHFPQAPIKIPGFTGFAWFPRQPEALALAMNGEYFSSLADLKEPDLAWSATELGGWINNHQTSGRSWILGGFSQGSMVALQTALQEKLTVLAVILLSGTLKDRTETTRLLQGTVPFPVFQSHGHQDPVLAFTGALALKELLQRFDFAPEFHEFTGGHEIPLTILESLQQFINTVSASR